MALGMPQQRGVAPYRWHYKFHSTEMARYEPFVRMFSMGTFNPPLPPPPPILNDLRPIKICNYHNECVISFFSLFFFLYLSVPLPSPSLTRSAVSKLDDNVG